MKQNTDRRHEVVANNIRIIREFRNYTQEYLAAKLAISQNAYSKIELGYSRITVERLFHVANILEIEVTTLLASDQADLIVIVEPVLEKCS